MGHRLSMARRPARTLDIRRSGRKGQAPAATFAGVIHPRRRRRAGQLSAACVRRAGPNGLSGGAGHGIANRPVRPAARGRHRGRTVDSRTVTGEVGGRAGTSGRLIGPDGSNKASIVAASLRAGTPAPLVLSDASWKERPAERSGGRGRPPLRSRPSAFRRNIDARSRGRLRLFRLSLSNRVPRQQCIGEAIRGATGSRAPLSATWRARAAGRYGHIPLSTHSTNKAMSRPLTSPSLLTSA